MKICSVCGKEFVAYPYHKKVKKFCSRGCANKSRIIEKFCELCGKSYTTDRKSKYCSKVCFYESRHKQAMEDILEKGYIEDSHRQTARKFLIESRGYRCEICNNTEWQGNPIPLVLDHIDGHSDNGHLENLRLICCNCDALLPTYKGRNKGNGRDKRRSTLS